MMYEFLRKHTHSRVQYNVYLGVKGFVWFVIYILGRGQIIHSLQSIPLQEGSCYSHVSCSYLVDPASSHILVLKIKPCMSKCFVFVTLDCGRLIITVIVLLRLLYRWIPVVILELIHVTKNIFFYILSIYLSSNQNAFALWMIHSNVWRTL